MNTGKTFLIVDDDPDDQELFIQALQEIDGYCTSVTASDGREAMDKLMNMEHQLPDFIFLDLNMPRMNGKEFLTDIKSNEKFSQIPVIIYSTSAERRDIEETKQLGAILFLQKPNRFDDLRAALKTIVANIWM